MHNKNFKSKVLIYGIFLILPLLFSNLSNKTKAAMLKQQRKNDNFKAKIDVITYQIPDTYSIVNLSIISKNEIFIFTNNERFHQSLNYKTPAEVYFS